MIIIDDREEIQLIKWWGEPYHSQPILNNVLDFLSDPLGYCQIFCSRYAGYFQVEKTNNGFLGRVNIPNTIQNYIIQSTRQNGDVDRIITGITGEVAVIDLYLNMVLEALGFKFRVRSKTNPYRSKRGKIGDGGVDAQIYNTFLDIKTRVGERVLGIAVNQNELSRHDQTLFVGANLTDKPKSNSDEDIVCYITGYTTVNGVKNSKTILPKSGDKVVDFPKWNKLDGIISFENLLRKIVILAALQEKVIQKHWVETPFFNSIMEDASFQQEAAPFLEV